MSIETLPIEHVNGEPLTLEQRQYLTGYFAGVAARGFRFSDVEPAPAAEAKPKLVEQPKAKEPQFEDDIPF